MEEKASDFLDSYTVVNEQGVKQINIVPAINELYSRLKTATLMLKEINIALGDFGQCALDLEKRIDKLEGNKKIILPTQEETNKILKG